MGQKKLLEAKGLYTDPNLLSKVPEGALVQADNVIIDRDAVIEPRRGIAGYGTDFGIGTDRSKQLLVYKNRILIHYADKLLYNSVAHTSANDGNFLEFDGSYTETETGLRIKYKESNRNLYFTTSDGIKKISAVTAADFTTAAGFIRDAGGIKALDITGNLNSENSGFLPVDSKVAYRLVWGYRDANNNLILGSPSSRLVVTNYNSSDSNVDLESVVPDNVTDEYFYQLYRTAVFTATGALTVDDIDPGDEMQLVVEDFPTAAELSSGIIQISDITPEDFRAGGAYLYTNPNSGEGIDQANEPPPKAKDLDLYQSTMFYANTETRANTTISLLGVSAMTSGVSAVTIDDGVNPAQTYTFVGEAEVTDFTFDTQANTNDAGYFLINSASNERKYAFYADKTGSTAAPSNPDLSGRIIYPVDISGAVTDNDVAVAFAAVINGVIDFDCPVPGGATISVTNIKNGNTDDALEGTNVMGGVFAINVTTQGDGEDAASNEVLLSSAPTPSQQIDESARSLVNIINKNANDSVYAYYISGSTDLPGQILLEVRDIGTNTFSVTANDATTGDLFNPSLPPAVGASPVTGEPEIRPNRLYYAKLQQPAAVPLLNFIDVGPQDKEISRILALRESLFILKEDGVYRLTGLNGSYTVDLFDESTKIIAPDTAVVLNNQIYCLTNQGVAVISDTGVDIISQNLDNIIQVITSSNYDYRLTSFGVSYETDRAYWLFVPSITTDTVATQAFRYNTFTQSWTNQPISKICGIVNSGDDKLYLGPNDENFIERERKNFNRTDYADREYEISLPADAVDGTSVTLSTANLAVIGDAIVQTQYLTANQFNKILRKLDLDPSVNDTNYFSSLEIIAGDNLKNKLDSLALKLDADSGINDTDYFASIPGATTTFEEIQTAFNIIVNKLNLDTGVLYSNYPLSSGTTELEALILNAVVNSATVTVEYSLKFVEGPITLFKGIQTSLIYVPETFGDPSVLKHIREGTFMFEDSNFTRASVGYRTDLSPGFEDIDFLKSGKGDWGSFTWSEQNWGGGFSGVPLRTYIPRSKQRCRYIQSRFQHDSAREKFAIFGTSYTLRGISEKAYRD